MRKKYLLPRQKVVEIDEGDALCQESEDIGMRTMKMLLNDYDTYTEPIQPKGTANYVNWEGEGTGSDF